LYALERVVEGHRYKCNGNFRILGYLKQHKGGHSDEKLFTMTSVDKRQKRQGKTNILSLGTNYSLSIE
jgi:hypothetical protein